MAGMFGQRSFGSRLRPQTMNDQLAMGGGVGGNRSLFGQMGGSPPPMPGAAQMMNSQNLDMLGARQFQGYQAGEDRDLEKLMQQRELANRLGLAGVDQQTQFGVQDRRNSGAIDQINTSGGWERAITGDKLGSNERMSALQRDLDLALARGGWEQQGLDRSSSEKQLQQELANREQIQRLVGDQQIGAINAKGGVDLGLQNLVGQQRMGELGLQGDQAMGLQGLVGSQNMGLQGLRGRQDLSLQGLVGDQNQSLERMRGNTLLDQTRMTEAGSNYRTERGLGTQERISEAELKGMLERSRADNATSRFNTLTDAGVRREGIGAQREGNVLDATVRREGIQAGLTQALGQQGFESSEAAKDREFRSSQLTAQLAAQYGDPKQRQAVQAYDVAKGAAEVRVAEAQARMIEAQSLVRSDPRMGEIEINKARTELATAMTQQATAEKILADAGLNAEKVKADIELIRAQTQSELNPTGPLQQMVDFSRNNPGVTVGGDSFQINPQLLGQGSTAANPLAAVQGIQGMRGQTPGVDPDASYLPFYHGSQGAQADAVIDQMFPGITDPTQKAILKQLMLNGGGIGQGQAPSGPYRGPMPMGGF